MKLIIIDKVAIDPDTVICIKKTAYAFSPWCITLRCDGNEKIIKSGLLSVEEKIEHVNTTDVYVGGELEDIVEKINQHRTEE